MANFSSQVNKLETELSKNNFNKPYFAPEIFSSSFSQPVQDFKAVDIAVQASLPRATGVGASIQATTSNRIVEDFGQGGIGDCWYLAAIKSLSISTLGKQSLFNVINSDITNASVTFQGAANYKYNTTASALLTEVNDGDTYTSNGHSSGDADVLLLEMALKDYFSNSTSKNSYFTSSPYSGGWMNQALTLITGKTSTIFNNWSNDLAATSAKLDELAGIIDHTAITCACMNQANSSLDIAASGHAYSIVAIDPINKLVSFRNPWYSGTTLKQISYANFSYYFQRIDYVDLTTNNQTIFGSNVGGTITTGTGSDLIYGGYGNDIINGGLGNDVMRGGAGNDSYYIDSANDTIVENYNEGIDTVYSAVRYALGSNLENLTLTGSASVNAVGNSLNNILTGNIGDNVLFGDLGADTMIGGLGNDSYYVDNAGDTVIENSNEGTDLVFSSVRFVLGANVENLTLTGTANVNAIGNTLNNVLTGNTGDNILFGDAGADTMAGGLGNDTYYVDNVNDSVVENISEGTDTVISYINYALGNNLENLTLYTGNINGTGNSYNNTIIGSTGDNIIDGGSGTDTMRGGLGNDTYYVDNFSDIVVENYNEGTDTVYSAVRYALGANVENLNLMGTASVNAVGNELNNTLKGNSGNNVLFGGAGNDTMLGGLGDDTYYVDSSSDIVTENSNEGTDTVYSSVRFVLGANVENLTLTGTANINAIGNSLDNVLTGNSGDNALWGDLGADTMIGGLGNDTYYVDNVNDSVVENISEGSDTVISYINYTLGNNLENLTLYTGNINGTGNSYNNTIMGSSGENMIAGAKGNDNLQGGAGNDTYVFNSGDGTDLISDSLGSDIISFGSGVIKNTVALFKQGVDLVFGYSNGDRISILGQSNTNNTIERFQLSSGEYMTNTDVNILIQQMTAYASGHGIQLSSVDSVLANQNLLTMVNNAWHS